jgi:ArsR family transcriptional regulator
MEDRYERASELFHLLSHAARLKILDELRRNPACVCHLEVVLGRTQAYVSQQLRVLREAGIVLSRRDGLYVIYRLADQRVERLLNQVLGSPGERASPDACSCPHCETESC